MQLLGSPNDDGGALATSDAQSDPSYPTNGTVYDEDGALVDFSSWYSSWMYNNSASALDTHGPETMVPVVLFAVAFLIGVPANGLVIFVLLRNQICRTTVNIYLLNLAVVDLFLLVFEVPLKLNLYILSSRNFWPFSTGMCKLSTYVVYVNMTVSILTLVALAVNRCNAVVRPVTCRTGRSSAHATVTLAIIWAVSLASQCPAVMMAHKMPIFTVQREDAHICVEKWPTLEALRSFKGVNFVAFYCVPLAVVSVCYLRMARVLTKSSRFMMGTETQPSSGWASVGGVALQRQQRSRRKVVRMVHILVLAFALCLLPYHVYTFIQIAWKVTLNDTLSLYFGIVSRWTIYFNSCLNPILYSFFSQNFRMNLKRSCSFRRLTRRLTRRQKTIAFQEKMVCQNGTFFKDDDRKAAVLGSSPDSGSDSDNQRSFTTRLSGPAIRQDNMLSTMSHSLKSPSNN